MGFFSNFNPAKWFQSSSVSDLKNPRFWLQSLGGRGPVLSGIDVTPDSSLQLSSYFAAIRNISEDIAKVPFNVFRKDASGRRELALDDPRFQTLRMRPNEDMSAMDFKSLLTKHALGWGNGYALIARRGSSISLIPVHPFYVRPERNIDSELIYRVTLSPPDVRVGNTSALETIIVNQEDMLDIRNFGTGIIGYSLARLGAESIGLSIAAERFGAKYFGSGTHLGIVFSHPEVLEEEAKQNITDSWMRDHSGLTNAHNVLVLEEGMQVHKINIPQNEAQFIETRNFQVEDIARWARIPPSKIGHLKDAIRANVEQQNQEYFNDCLLSWAVRWEQELEWKLFRDTGLEVEADFSVLLRGDSTARSAYWREQVFIGAATPNEVRISEGRNPDPSPAADMLYMQSSMVPINRLASSPAVEQVPVNDDDDEELEMEEIYGWDKP